MSVYVAGQIIPPFLIGLFAFTLVFLAGRIVQLVELVVSRGASVGQVAKLFVLVLPALLETTLPMAFLLGILYGCGRLARDSEALALKACGVGPLHFLIPVGLAALAVSLLTLGLSVFARPAANLAVKQELYSIAQSRAGSLLKEQVFNDIVPGVLIYVDRVVPPGNTFQGVLIVDRRDRNSENVIIGRVALLHSGADSLGLRLYDGTVHERRRKRAEFSQTSFNVYNLHLELGQLLAPLTPQRRRPGEMPLPRLRETIRSKSAHGEAAVPEIMELHRRFAFPFAPLIFAVLGIAIVLVPNRVPAGRSHGVASCLAWLFAYYALLSVGTAMAETARIPSGLGPWLPNLVVGLASIGLFAKALRESPQPLRQRAEQLLRAARQRFAGPGPRQ